jgi:hypothetical protein
MRKPGTNFRIQKMSLYHRVLIFAGSMNRFLHISTPIYLSLIILFKMMAMPISLLEYSLNKSFIAANLCENRAKSEMHCAGKCYLNKKLARSNDSQDSQNTKGGSRLTIVDYCESIENPSLRLNKEIPLLYNSSLFIVELPNRNLSAVFRPPIA